MVDEVIGLICGLQNNSIQALNSQTLDLRNV